VICVEGSATDYYATIIRLLKRIRTPGFYEIGPGLAQVARTRPKEKKNALVTQAPARRVKKAG